MSYIIGRGRYARETYPEPPGGGGGGCALQFCADYERDDRIELAAAPGSFLLPRQQGVTDNPLRCEFSSWTPGSFLQVWAACAFNLRQRQQTGVISFVGSHRIAINLGAGWLVAARTGRTMSQVLQVGGVHVTAGTIAHATILGPFDVAPHVAILARWSLSTGAGMETGQDAGTEILSELPAGLSLACAELGADCVVEAQPPELSDISDLVSPVFIAPA
jgi:hypothetical protein